MQVQRYPRSSLKATRLQSRYPCPHPPYRISLLKKLTTSRKSLWRKLVQDGGVIAGYKAGLTSPPAQKKFKAPGPVTGVLLKSMQIKDGTVDSTPFSKMMLEVEIGYRLNRDIKTPTTPETVKTLVDEIMPAVEVPDLNFATFKGLAFTDIIADNVGARGFILGNPQPVNKVDPNQRDRPAVHGRKSLGTGGSGKGGAGRSVEGALVEPEQCACQRG
jgi:2-keto-4-pentenoate hydratase